MTVCIAVLFKWNYGGLDETAQWRTAALTASDRMLTAGDVEYEPQQQKVAQFGQSIVLVAGDIQLHREAIAQTEKEIRGRTLQPQDIAQIYGRAMQAINRRHAENEILVPLGLNSDTFFGQMKDFPESFVSMIVDQMQNRKPEDAEALIVGTDGEDSHIYLVDSHGNDFNLDAVGFGAIGIGGWHAKSRLMQIAYNQRDTFARAQASIYAAKKNAEIAPGVGKQTDLFLVARNGHEPVLPPAIKELEKLFKKFTAKSSKLGNQMVAEYQKFIDDRNNWSGAPNDNGQAGKRSQIDAGNGSESTKTSHGNDGGKEDVPAVQIKTQSKEEA